MSRERYRIFFKKFHFSSIWTGNIEESTISSKTFDLFVREGELINLDLSDLTFVHRRLKYLPTC